MDDDYWSYETIKKDFFRYRSYSTIDFNHNAYQHLEELILINMFNTLTVVSDQNMIKISIQEDSASFNENPIAGPYLPNMTRIAVQEEPEPLPAAFSKQRPIHQYWDTSLI